MPKKIVTVRPSLAFAKLNGGGLLFRANAVAEGTAKDPGYKASPVSEEELKGGIDNYAVAKTAAIDGGKTALAERDKKRDELIAMLRKIAHYAEHVSKGDAAALLAAGFEVVTRKHSAPQPLSQPTIQGIE